MPRAAPNSAGTYVPMGIAAWAPSWIGLPRQDDVEHELLLPGTTITHSAVCPLSAPFVRRIDDPYGLTRSNLSFIALCSAIFGPAEIQPKLRP